MDDVVLYLLVLIIPFIATIKINLVTSKFRQVKSKCKLTGLEVARKILDSNGLKDMYIVLVKGNMTDHYDPNQKVVRLSEDVYNGDSILSLAVAAHECGHAVQDKENYQWLRFRSMLVPIVNLITYSAYIVFFISLFLQMADLLLLSVALVFFSLLFQVVTLPVEINASKRAIVFLKDLDLVQNEEVDGAEDVLKAAAFTYVAAVLSSIINLLRLISLMNDRRD